MKTSFETYLKQRDYSQSTVMHYTKRVEHFQSWLIQKHLSLDEFEYKSALDYIRYLRRKKWKPQTINLHLASLKIYVDYIAKHPNPFKNLKLKDVQTPIKLGLLTDKELEVLYMGYQDRFSEVPEHLQGVFYRNRVIVGLLVFQGLSVTDLKMIRLEGLAIEKGKITISRSKKLNGRVLELRSIQIMGLLAYKAYRERSKKGAFPVFLFDENLYLNDVITSSIIKKLKLVNAKVKNSYQLRASVITNLLDHYNLRRVQYLVGHKYISSTAKYRKDELESLQSIIEEDHPIR